MKFLLPVLIFGAALLVLAAATAVNRRRSQGIAGWAAANGWQYAAHDDQYNDLLSDFPFGTGYNRSSDDVVTGTAHGHRAVCFTYHYDLNQGLADRNDRQGRYFAVWSLRLPKALPSLHVSREGIASSTVHPSGLPAIEVGDAKFRLKFKVSSDNADFAAAVFDTPMLQFLLDSDGPGFTISGADIVAIRRGGLTAATALSQLDYLAAVIDHLPAA